MDTGLYFPHTMCRDKELLKSALFLFDEFEYIVPWEGFEKEYPSEDPHVQETVELIGKPIIPSPVEQKAAHKEIAQVCMGKMASQLNFRPSGKREDGGYLIFPQKFDQATWDLLEEKKLIKQLGKEVDYDYFMTQILGQFMMAMLALACSGNKKQKKQLVTDNPNAFKALYLASADDIRTNLSKIQDAHHWLLNIRIKSFDFKKISFSRILSLRKKETPLLHELRKNYLENHQSCLSEIEEVSNNPREIDRCIRRYTDQAEQNLKELKQALRLHSATTLLSKTIVSAVAGIASETIVPSSGFLASSAVLVSQLIEYKDKRRELLKNHKFAWFYEVGKKYKLY